MTTGADRQKLNKDAGFSLVELLIAVIILAIIVIPLMNLFVS
ncbi:MAG: prepilin-type N-terminal cleavage/methylation domain-containing protein, partial [Lachnospiraceae bacterium]|nr:prepilin-type N-terminal cleavage/methylation domain-containing protein [Lachnospiraceae bacterium]